MTRDELYALIWETPIVHVARQLGMSNIGLRKLCDDYDIPTPPAGYWTKLAHGKPVEKPSLPPRKSRLLDQINLTFRRLAAVPNQIADEQIANFSLTFLTDGSLEKGKPHRAAAALAKDLKGQRADDEGFVRSSALNLPRIRIGRGSIDRVVALVDGFLKMLLQRGHRVIEADDGIHLDVRDERFVFKVYETRARRALNERADIRGRQAALSGARQAETAKVWRLVPSGQLCLEISDPRPLRWNSRNLVGRWYDREGRAVEQCLGDAATALAAASEVVRHCRAEADAQANAAAAEAARRVAAVEQGEREQQRREFLMTKAQEYSQLTALSDFAAFMALQTSGNGTEPVDRITAELQTLVEEMRRSFDRPALNAEIRKLGLFSGDDAD